MKHLLLVLGLLTSVNLCAGDLFSIRNNKIIPTGNHKLWTIEEKDHSEKNYKLIDATTVKAGNGYAYDIKSYQHKDDDWDMMGDSIFSKLVITCRTPADTATSQPQSTGFVFLNDNEWLRFNYWSFSPYSDNPWFAKGNEVFKVYELSNDCIAIVLRGFRDSVSPPELTVFVLYKDNAKLVYNADWEIDSIATEKSVTVMNIANHTYDEEGYMKLTHASMVFGLGRIVLKSVK